MIKNHPDALDILNQIRKKNQNSNHAISLSTNNLRPLLQKKNRLEMQIKRKKHMFKAMYKKTGFTHIFSLLLIKLHGIPIFFLEKQLHISKVAIKILIFIIVLALLSSIIRLIKLN